MFGHGDEYFASDKNGKVTNMEMNAELRDRLPSRRSTTATQLASRHSHTVSMSSLPSDRDMKPTVISASDSPPRRVLQRRKTIRSGRPQSISVDGSSFLSWLERKTEREGLVDANSNNNINDNVSPPVVAAPELRKVSYVDAGVQTESDMAGIEIPPSTRHSRANSDYCIRRTMVNRNDQQSISDPSLYCPPNPIIMGKMHSYFRASRYKLGDALQRPRLVR